MNKVDQIIKRVYAELRNRAAQDEVPEAHPDSPVYNARWQGITTNVNPPVDLSSSNHSEHVSQHAALLNEQQQAPRHRNYLTATASRLFGRE